MNMISEKSRAKHFCISLYPEEAEYLSLVGGGPRFRGRGRGHISGVTEGIRTLIEQSKDSTIEQVAERGNPPADEQGTVEQRTTKQITPSLYLDEIDYVTRIGYGPLARRSSVRGPANGIRRMIEYCRNVPDNEGGDPMTD